MPGLLGTVMLSIGLLACSGGGGREAASPTTAAASTIGSSPTAPPSSMDHWAIPGDDPLVEEMTDDLMAVADDARAPFPLAEAQARCLSSTLLRRVGLDTLARVGEQLTPGGRFDLGELTLGERNRFANAILTCLDLPQVLSSQLRGIEGLVEDELACVVRELTREGTIRVLVRRSLVEGTDLTHHQDELADPMTAAFTTCLPPDEVDRLSGGGDG